MAFNIALSGLNAASSDLRVTGNNIANASTNGFKASRAEFADVYASSVLGAGSNQVGSGVKLSNISQQFDQGTISFTNNSLDLAIDGSGFFVLSDNGAREYTRAGAFGLDETGFLVSNSGQRVQGFTANETGNLSGIQGDLRVNPSNLAPNRTSLVEATINLDAGSEVLSQLGTTLTTDGSAVGVANPGQPTSTPSTLSTIGPPAPFDYSTNTASSVSASNGILPFDFGINSPSAVSATSAVGPFDFSINSPSSLTGSGTPSAFNFADKPSALTGTAASTPFDFSGGNSGSFDVSIAGAPSAGTRTVTLNSNITNLSDLVSSINSQLAGIGVQARANPNNSTQLQLFATVAGQASTISLNNFAGSGSTNAGNVQAALSGLADGSQSIRSSFDVTVAGATNNGTVSVTLTNTVSQITTLLADVRDQLDSSGLSLGVREDLDNPGRLEFFSTDNGVASTITVDNFQTTDADVEVADIAGVLRLDSGASSTAPGTGAIGVTGSLTEASFDVSISGGSGPGGNATATVRLDQNYNGGDLIALINDINTQLNAVPGSGIDVIAEEDPNNPGRLRLAAATDGEASTVSVTNFQTSGIAGDVVTQASDITNVLGGIIAGASNSTGNNTSVSFQVSLTGSSIASQNQTVNVTLDSSVSTLQDLINDIRNDLIGTGIGIDVREDPANLGRLQFYALNSGEGSVIRVDPNDNAVFGIGVNRANVQAALGGISLGQSGLGGSSNVTPDPFGSGATSGTSGNVSSASFDVTVSGSSTNDGTATIQLTRNIRGLDDLILDIRDELLVSGLPVDVREDPIAPGRLQFFSTGEGDPASIAITNLNTTNIGVSQLDLVGTLNLAGGGSVPGIPAVSNGYREQQVDVNYPDGSTQTITIPEGSSAVQTAALLGGSNVLGVSASADTIARLPAAGFNNASGLLELTINGEPVSGSSLTELNDTINNGVPRLGTLTSALDVNGDLVLTDAVGNDLVVALTAGQAADGVQVAGINGAPISLTPTGNAAASVGGAISLTLDDGVTLSNASPAISNLFGPLDPSMFEEFDLNTFDPTNQDTYNAATSLSIFDSLGNPHALSLFFVKERFEADTAGSAPNSWTMYALIDNEDVGDPDPNLPPPQNTEPTRASFAVRFNEDGSIDPAGTEEILISNWTPLGPDGLPNGADGALNSLAGGSLPVPDPATSSNFEIRLGDSTQYGSEFVVNALEQDGFTTGELSGLSIDDAGVISARFTNAQNQILGQIAVADFTNVQGLAAIGDTAWVQTNESGEPVVAAPGSGSLGVITSGALEDSNVELSEQLVQLIIAQRNFQANARTITTSDEITQTIINI